MSSAMKWEFEYEKAHTEASLLLNIVGGIYESAQEGMTDEWFVVSDRLASFTSKGFHNPVTDEIVIRLPRPSTHRCNDERLMEYFIVITGHEYVHSVLTKHISLEASFKYDNVALRYVEEKAV